MLLTSFQLLTRKGEEVLDGGADGILRQYRRMRRQSYCEPAKNLVVGFHILDELLVGLSQGAALSKRLHTRVPLPGLGHERPSGPILRRGKVFKYLPKRRSKSFKP